MSYIYVASPYSDPNPAVVRTRYQQVSYYCVSLLNKRKWFYSPIVSNHHLAETFKLDTDANSWMAFNFCMLLPAKELHVLALPGFEKSIGVTAEVAFWRGVKEPLGMPIYFIEWDTSKIVI